jgi:hypothetical protein
MDQKAQETIVRMTSGYEVAFVDKKSHEAQALLLKIFQDLKMKFFPSSMECKATPCDYR